MASFWLAFYSAALCSSCFLSPPPPSLNYLACAHLYSSSVYQVRSQARFLACCQETSGPPSDWSSHSEAPVDLYRSPSLETSSQAEIYQCQSTHAGEAHESNLERSPWTSCYLLECQMSKEFNWRACHQRLYWIQSGMLSPVVTYSRQESVCFTARISSAVSSPVCPKLPFVVHFAPWSYLAYPLASSVCSWCSCACGRPLCDVTLCSSSGPTRRNCLFSSCNQSGWSTPRFSPEMCCRLDRRCYHDGQCHCSCSPVWQLSSQVGSCQK